MSETLKEMLALLERKWKLEREITELRIKRDRLLR